MLAPGVVYWLSTIGELGVKEVKDQDVSELQEQATKEGDSSPVTTVTVFTFTVGARLWAFLQMGLARPLFQRVPGLRFYKLMGAGRGSGFTLQPDWSRYVLLAVWEGEEYARKFLTTSSLIQRYYKRAARMATVILRTHAAHGAWDGANPFLPVSAVLAGSGRPIAVLTRATIRPWRLRAFWSQVPRVSETVGKAPGLLAAIGIGEAPFLRQATLSLWETLEAMQQFAYGSVEHVQAMKRTRQEGWYSEELFARFTVVEQTDGFP